MKAAGFFLPLRRQDAKNRKSGLFDRGDGRRIFAVVQIRVHLRKPKIMIPIDLELLKKAVPILVVWGLIISWLWSRVEHPLRTVQLDGRGDEAFRKLREIIDRKGFSKLEEDEDARRIKIKGVLKIVDVILWRCWSKEIIFQVIDDSFNTKLTVTCKPSPYRITASRESPNYLSRESLDRILEELKLHCVRAG